jgi:UDP-3-O-[3-hydroxymyristoyl] N-acetylglucosamine deacetylase/3-hydroxyacyl-[acyl-carrier-protein] dehydratase
MNYQSTIGKEVSISGIGLHTGKEVTLTFKPAPVNHGYKFKRIDLPNTPLVSADVSKVVKTNRGTTIQQGDASISTIEHALAALAGLQIDNVLMEIDGPEVPIMDGSSQSFVAAIQQAGISPQEEERTYFTVESPITYKDPESGAEITALPADELQITALIDFNSSFLGQQYAELNNIQDFTNEIAPCRTFVFLHEVEHLFDQNLIKGGDFDNAIVIADKPMTSEELVQLSEKLNKPKIEINSEGVLNTVKLTFKNEPARHKLLDIIGDMALLGMPIKGKIIANKPGHTINVEFTKVLKEHLKEQKKLRGRPVYNPDEIPVLDANQVAAYLPHRYPFLLVDKVIKLTKEEVVGVKNVTFNEPFFQGHFPNNPIMPGVLQIEALAQVGGILAMHIVGDPGEWDTYFLKIDNGKFKQKVIPGDTLMLKMELLAPIRRGICQMKGTTYVGNKIVSEAELTAQIVKRT